MAQGHPLAIGTAYPLSFGMDGPFKYALLGDKILWCGSWTLERSEKFLCESQGEFIYYDPVLVKLG